MTKQTADDTTLKCHMTVEGANKVGESVTKMTYNDALIICDVNADVDRKDQPKTTPIKTGIEAKRKIEQHVVCFPIFEGSYWNSF